jgi:hypothetical protein
MSYGTNLADAYRLEGNYVGRIARVRNGNFFYGLPSRLVLLHLRRAKIGWPFYLR